MWLKIKIKNDSNKIIEKNFETASEFLQRCEADNTDLDNEIIDINYHGEFDMDKSDEIQTVEDLYNYFCLVL